ncbi:hypothetical protein LCGC14_2231090 [marine sediment metagenome]|uniref:Uncharacterized protein n=1 Tax=marine sediment metagenome TaxID=412755 RepID=A0A0F9D8H0_9ZZZZ
MSFIGKIFGKSSGEKRLARFQPASFSSPGLSGTFKDNRFTLRRGAETSEALGDIRSLSQEQAGAFRGLRDRVKPGFGELTRTRIDAIRNAGKRTIGNLREELGKRRVLGSTFASREIASTEAEFGRIEEQSRAESFLQELALTGELIKEEFSSSISGVLEILKQLNFETAIGAGLSQSASAQLNANLIAQSEARAAQQAAGEDFLGTVLGFIFG